MILSRKVLLPTCLSGLLSLSLTACFHDEDAVEEHDIHSDNEISLTLSSAQVINSDYATSTDTGTANLLFHESEGELTGSITLSGEEPGAVHVHVGYAGQTGVKLITLEKSDTDSTLWEIPEAQANLIDTSTLEAGGYYLNAHLANDQTLRAQITTDHIAVRVAALEPHSGVTTTGKGFVGVTVNTETHEVTAYVSISDLEDNSGVHLHVENADETNSQKISLDDISVNTDKTSYKTPDGSTLEADAMENIESARWYINVHNATTGNGELKGSLAAISHH